MNPLLITDFYKVHHHRMYPEGTTMIYSNFTPRKSRMKGVDKVVFFGLQHFIKKYLIEYFTDYFFWRKGAGALTDGSGIFDEYKRHIPVETEHIKALLHLGYLPIEIKALPEGTLCPIGVPCLTIRNTHPDFAWLTNYLETLISCMLWQPITSATIAHEYKKLLTKYAKETDEKNLAFVDWQGHDFSMRGMSSVESAILSGMGHLLSFTGTDTIPAIYALEESYEADGLIGASVPATEHSVMCMGEKDSEIETFKRLLDLYPTGILSVVSDTWDLWKVCTEYLPALKDQILARAGKLVIRPDSGDPVDILCGLGDIFEEKYQAVSKKGVFRFRDKLYTISNQLGQTGQGEFIMEREVTQAEQKGVIELLWDVFGGTVNEQGYKVLDPHIGAIYGDSITLERAEKICERLKVKGFASTNIVLGIGSYTYQYNTRDTFGFAMKATYGEVRMKHPDGFRHCINVGREIFKEPITDSGEKKSAKGLLQVYENGGDIALKQQCIWEEEAGGLLQTVFKDGKLVKDYILSDIKKKLSEYETKK